MQDRSKELLLRYEKSLDCIHCGLCLTSCPTYLQTGNEVDSPRGRIALMRALAEGELSIEDGVKDPMELCLLCRACESTCPSAVQYGTMMEITRHEIHRQEKTSFGQRFLMNRVLTSRRWLSFVATLTRCYTHWGLRSLMRGIGLTKLLPTKLQRMDESIPEIPPRSERRPLAPHYAHQGKKRGRVAVLSGCVMPELFGEINRKTVDALTAHGYEVVVPQNQGCCGALHIHAGDATQAQTLAKQNVRAFLDADVDWIVLNSAGCGASMSEYGHWFDDGPDKDEAERMSAKVIDIMELFAREKLTPRGGLEERAVYDAPCHLHHAQGCQTGPVEVLKRVPKLELLAMAKSEQCCGAAGIYNITQPDMSDAILEDKLDALAASGANVLITGNPGCILQWRKGIKERGLEIQVRHPVDYL